MPRLGGSCDLLVQAAGGGVHLVGHGGAAGMAGVFDDDELGTGPGAGELPRGAGATAEVVTTVDQDAGDAGRRSPGSPRSRQLVEERAGAGGLRAWSDGEPEMAVVGG